MENNPYSQKSMTALLEECYRKALYEAKRTGQSIESMTYEILEGVGESALLKPEYAEEGLKNIVDIISATLKESAQERIYAKKRKLYWAKKQLSEAIEAEQSYMTEAIEACREYAKEKSLRTLEEQVHQYESKLSSDIYILADKIKYNAE